MAILSITAAQEALLLEASRALFLFYVRTKELSGIPEVQKLRTEIDAWANKVNPEAATWLNAPTPAAISGETDPELAAPAPQTDPTIAAIERQAREAEQHARKTAEKIKKEHGRAGLQTPGRLLSALGNLLDRMGGAIGKAAKGLSEPIIDFMHKLKWVLLIAVGIFLLWIFREQLFGKNKNRR